MKREREGGRERARETEKERERRESEGRERERRATSTVRVAHDPANRQKEPGLRGGVGGDPQGDLLILFFKK